MYHYYHKVIFKTVGLIFWLFPVCRDRRMCQLTLFERRSLQQWCQPIHVWLSLGIWRNQLWNRYNHSTFKLKPDAGLNLLFYIGFNEGSVKFKFSFVKHNLGRRLGLNEWVEFVPLCLLYHELGCRMDNLILNPIVYKYEHLINLLQYNGFPHWSVSWACRGIVVY